MFYRHCRVLFQYRTFVIAGVTPLMLAVKKENLVTTKYLLGKKAATNDHDNEKNTVYHYAANTNKDIIEAVCSNLEETRVAAKYSKSDSDQTSLVPPSAQILNVPNLEGNTPLHIACLNDKPDCVHALL